MAATIDVYSLVFTKADLDAAPKAERLFYLMATGLANEVQMLNKTLAVVVESADGGQRIVNQANSAFSMLILRILSGRLWEGWGVISGASGWLRSDYEPIMSAAGVAALRDLRAIFHQKGGSFLKRLRDKVAFHSDAAAVEAAYDKMRPDEELGEYICRTVGNTLHYSAELLHYRTLSLITGEPDHEAAVRLLLTETQRLTPLFNDVINAFVLVFAERYLSVGLARMRDERETLVVGSFEDQRLSFFSKLPGSQRTQDDVAVGQA